MKTVESVGGGLDRAIEAMVMALENVRAISDVDRRSAAFVHLISQSAIGLIVTLALATKGGPDAQEDTAIEFLDAFSKDVKREVTSRTRPGKSAIDMDAEALEFEDCDSCRKRGDCKIEPLVRAAKAAKAAQAKETILAPEPMPEPEQQPTV